MLRYTPKISVFQVAISSPKQNAIEAMLLGRSDLQSRAAALQKARGNLSLRSLKSLSKVSLAGSPRCVQAITR